MGEHKVHAISTEEERISFIRHLFDDIRALEIMHEEKLIESGITRVGAEQEFCLVNENWRPAKNSEQILQAINNDHFTTELARYNLEINLDPFELTGNCFNKAERQLTELLNIAESAAKKNSSKVLLTGILPTISKNELEFDYMTPNQRYWTLNEKIREVRGSDFDMHFRGVDELSIVHDTVLFEACNTSFQVHLQVDPDDFASSYNWSQAISGPVLSVCTNSPLLLGRELWSETRIALFQQSIDTRSSSYALKDQQARVTYGNSWGSGSIVDIYKNDIAKYKVILGIDLEESSLEALKSGKIPKLRALSLHNGTIYRWNRPCYGVGNGKPHVRIESRYLPSGPTVMDQMANFALWAGVMCGRPPEYDNMNVMMDFRDAKANFIKAARTGSESILLWNDELVPAGELLRKEFLPMAFDGLTAKGIDRSDADKLLKVIDQRIGSQTGSQWILHNYRGLKQKMKPDDALVALTKGLSENQHSGNPVGEWPQLEKVKIKHNAAEKVGHIMSTQLFTVNEDDLAELAVSIMKWQNIHHVPVENSEGTLCGLLTWTHLEKFTTKDREKELPVSAIMITSVLTVSPETSIREAIDLMRSKDIGCLPVIQSEQLVGIITVNDIIEYIDDKDLQQGP